jgi:hypothetical protein
MTAHLNQMHKRYFETKSLMQNWKKAEVVVNMDLDVETRS